ncbi:MAG TPA: hypothetical protein VFU27_04125 [Terriglobales bacterium]|nr:hypothetical protein [Terriglobales bacterium]
MRKTALLVLTTLALGLMVWAQQPAGFKGTRTVDLSEQAKIGSQVLAKGEYRVTHEMEGSEHIMIFKKGKDQFRFKCNLEPLQAKANATQFWYATDASGSKVLEALVFRGDTVRHVFAQ